MLGLSLNLSLAPAGDDGSDFNLITFVQHFVFGHEIIAFDDQVCFDDEIQLSQEILDLLRALDFNRSGWMAQLDLHGRIISRRYMREQGAVKAVKDSLAASLNAKWGTSEDPRLMSDGWLEGGLPVRG